VVTSSASAAVCIGQITSSYAHAPNPTYFDENNSSNQGRLHNGGNGARCSMAKMGGFCDNDDTFARVYNNLLIHVIKVVRQYRQHEKLYTYPLQ